MGSSELQIQQQMPSSHQQTHEQLQQLYCHNENNDSNSKDSAAENDRAEFVKKVNNFNGRDDDEQTYSLSWKEFPTNFVSFFKDLRESDEMIDVTLACEGKQITAHKLVLAASSPFFRRLLISNPCQHPIIILNEVKFAELTPLLHYMYHGEVNVHYDQITSFLRTAKLLQVRGLIGESPENLSKRTLSSGIKSEDSAVNDRLRSKSPVEERRSESPAAKRSKTSNNNNSSLRQSSSPSLGRNNQSPPARENNNSPPSSNVIPTPIVASLPPLPGLPLPLSMPSSLSSLPAISNSIPLSAAVHGPPQSTPFPSHLFGSLYNHQQNHSDDASDAGGSDPSDDRNRLESEVDEDHENSLEKMSGLANMEALKGLAVFPGTSGLMGLTSGAALRSNNSMDQSVGEFGRPSYDFYRVRATDPRPCALCGKIYKNAHTLRTHMEDKHSNCNGFRCVLCGTVAKSRNSLHSHMSRQHRGISTKDLPLLAMPAPWNPEIASKYIQIVGGVGEVVRQNYRRPERDANGREIGDGTLGSDASTPTSQENGALSPYVKTECEKDQRRSLDVISRQLDMSAAYGAKPPTASLLDTYLQMVRASGVGVDLMHGMHGAQEKVWEELRQNAAAARNAPVGLDLTRNTSSPSNFEDDDVRGSDHYNSDDEYPTKDEKTNGTDRAPVVTVTPRSPVEKEEGKK